MVSQAGFVPTGGIFLIEAESKNAAKLQCVLSKLKRTNLQPSILLCLIAEVHVYYAEHHLK